MIKKEDYGELLVDLIREGQTGNNIGLQPSIDRLPSVLQKQIIQLMGGTGSGKTYAAFNVYGVHPMSEWLRRFKDDPDRVFHWIIFSFEMAKDELILRLAAYFYAVATRKMVPSHVIAGFESGLQDEDRDWIIKHCAPRLSEISPYFTIYPSKSLKGITGIIHNFYKQYGDLDKQGNYVTDKKITLMCTVDHLGLISGQGSKKTLIDELIKFQVMTTTIYRTSWINVQQLNRGEGDMQKLRGGSDPRPTLAEAKDSGDGVDAAHVVVVIYNPNRFDLKDYLGYPIETNNLRQGLEDRLRVWFILKRRFGQVGYVATAFYGEAGLFQKMPLPEHLTQTQVKRILEGTWFAVKPKTN